jgi:hypothetical protein
MDMLILAGCVTLVSLFRRNVCWLRGPRLAELLFVTLLGVAYTGVSEYVSVHLRHSWGYSPWIPLVPWLRIGLVPLLQWLLLKDYLGGLRYVGYGVHPVAEVNRQAIRPL